MSYRTIFAGFSIAYGLKRALRRRWRTRDRKAGCVRGSGMRIAVAAMLAMALFGAGPASAQTALAPYEKPQTLATLAGGRKLNLVCQGQGSPTVILTAGAEDWSASWNQVQPLVA